MPRSGPTFRVRNIPAPADSHAIASLLAREISSVSSAEDVIVLSLARSPTVNRSVDSRVASVCFTSLPPELNDGTVEWMLRSTLSGKPCSLTLDTHFHDLTVLNDPQWDSQGSAFADCIALPGLTDHPVTTWTSSKQPDYFWLRDSLPSLFPRLRSSLYGYDSRLADHDTFRSIDDIARCFTQRLRSFQHPYDTRPTCFIAHSVGGIILKKALLLLAEGDDSDLSILRSIRCSLMFGCPNQGLPRQSLEAIVSRKLSPVIFHELGDRSAYVNELNDAVLANPHLAHIRIISFHETRKSDWNAQSQIRSPESNAHKKLLVDVASAARLGEPQTTNKDTLAIDKDHAHLVSFTEHDFSFQSVRACLRDFCTDAGIAVPTTARTDSLSPLTMTRDRATTFSGPAEKTSPDLMALDWSTVSSRRSNDDDTVPRWSRHSVHGIDHWEGPTLNDSVSEEKLRFSKIRRPLASSCNWAYKYKDLGFQSWLDHGSGIFHIGGDAGTGKSVLMRHLVLMAHSLVKPNEDMHDTIITSYFFDRTGSAEHKTLDSFRQSTLCQLLMVEPHLRPLMESIIPAEYTFRKRWNSLRLHQGMARLVTQHTLPVRIIIFIDALEVCSSAPADTGRALRELLTLSAQSATRLSICIASRPHPALLAALPPGPAFRMEQQTKLFLRIYVKERLAHLRPSTKPPRDNAAFLGGRGVMASGVRRTGDYYELVERVMDKARGSYEWARHALTVLDREAVDNHDVKELIGIVRDLPDKPGELARLRQSYR